MKKNTVLFLVFLFLSCKKTAIPEPKNLIDKEKMVNILYDIAIIEAVKITYPYTLQIKGVNTQTYIYKKYKIDSIQFAKSDKFYATDVKQYGKMYQKVVDRIKEQKKKDSIALLPKPLTK